MTIRSLLLGIDISPRRLGWGLVNLITGEPVDCGCEALWPNPREPVDWTQQVFRTRKAIDRVAFGGNNPNRVNEIQAVYIEDTSKAGKFRQHDAGRAQGIVEAQVLRRWPHAYPIQSMKPSEWRTEVGLPGNASKAAVMEAASRFVHEQMFDGAGYFAEAAEIKNQDAADALLIARAGWKRNNETWERGQ